MSNMNDLGNFIGTMMLVMLLALAVLPGVVVGLLFMFFSSFGFWVPFAASSITFLIILIFSRLFMK